MDGAFLDQDAEIIDGEVDEYYRLVGICGTDCPQFNFLVWFNVS